MDASIIGVNRDTEISTLQRFDGVGIDHGVFLTGENAGIVHIQTHGTVIVLDSDGQFAIGKRNVTATISGGGHTAQIGLVERIFFTVQRKAVSNHVGAIQRKVGRILGENDRNKLVGISKRNRHLDRHVQVGVGEIDVLLKYSGAELGHVDRTVRIHGHVLFAAGKPAAEIRFRRYAQQGHSGKQHNQ